MKTAKRYMVKNVDVNKQSKAALVMESMSELLIEGQDHIQNKDFIHCDIKPANIMSMHNRALRLDQSTLNQVTGYFNQALECIPDHQVAPDYDQALAAIEQNRLLTHPHWSKQLQLSASHRQSVMGYYDFVDAQSIAAQLYPLWSVSQPEAAIAKQAQRGALLSIETEQGKRYPVQQFDLNARTPMMLTELKQLISQVQEQQLTHLELLHWLCSPIEITVAKKDMAFEQHLAKGEFESALQNIADSGPSPTMQLIPIEVCQQGNQALFRQLVSQWLSPEPIEVSPQVREVAIENLKAQMAALGISKLSLEG